MNQSDTLENSASDTMGVKIHNQLRQPVKLVLKTQGKPGAPMNLGVIQDNEFIDLAVYEDDVLYAHDMLSDEILQVLKNFKREGCYLLVPQPRKDKIKEVVESNYSVFAQRYFEKNKKDWITVYPRCKTLHPILKTGKLGSKRLLKSTATFFDAPRPEQVFEAETVSQSPRIFVIENFLSTYEADRLILLAQGNLARSTIINKDGSGLVESDIRTSSTCWVKYSDDPMVENIFDRVSDVMGINRSLVKYQASESLQLVRYEKGQEFKHHHDYLDPFEHTGTNSVLRGNNRMATFLFYLVTPEEGGETDFPLSDARAGGLKVKLKKGSAILFYNMLPDGNLDEKSLHAGLPVMKGEKYIANLWFGIQFLFLLSKDLGQKLQVRWRGSHK